MMFYQSSRHFFESRPFCWNFVILLFLVSTQVVFSTCLTFYNRQLWGAVFGVEKSYYSFEGKMNNISKAFLVGVFEENARLLQWLVFFVSSTRSVNFFVHLFNIINLNYGRPKDTRNARISSKTKTSTPRISKTGPFGVFHSDFFRHYATFLDSTKGPPLRLFRYFATQWMSKNPKGSPFYIFRHCDTVQKSHLKIFTEIFENLSRVTLNFFSYFAPNWRSTL